MNLMDPEEFAAWLRDARNRLKVSQATVARYGRLSRETVRVAELGHRIDDRSRRGIEAAISQLEARATDQMATRADINELREAMTALTDRIAQIAETNSSMRQLIRDLHAALDRGPLPDE